MVSTWLIVRHAETQWNLEGRVQGHTDVPLSEKGLRQVEDLRSRLSEWKIDAAYASDLKRTMETARIALDGRDLSVRPVPELREFAYGRWEGLNYGQVAERDPVLYARMLERREDFAPPEGESLMDLMARVGGFVSWLRDGVGPTGSEVRASRKVPRAAESGRDEEDGDRTLLIVGHGGSLRVLLTCVLELPAAASWRFMLATSSLSVVDCYPDNAVLKLLNDTSFLSRELGPHSKGTTFR